MTWSAEPQSDGTLRGVYTNTGLTNECGLAGVVRQSPIVLTRVGDVPPTVTVADPQRLPRVAALRPRRRVRCLTAHIALTLIWETRQRTGNR